MGHYNCFNAEQVTRHYIKHVFALENKKMQISMYFFWEVESHFLRLTRCKNNNLKIKITY